MVLLIVLVVILALIALGVFIFSRVHSRNAPGDAESGESPGTYYGEAIPTDHHPTRDFIGEEPEDLQPDPEAEQEMWEAERERYREKNEPT